MKRYRNLFSVERMSKVLGVSRAGFYKYLKSAPTKRQQEDNRLACMIKKTHTESHQSYGYRRHMDALREGGEVIGKGRVIRLMKANNIRAKYKKPFRSFSKIADKNATSPNILSRDFKAQKPNDKWVSDSSYIPTKNGFLYLAVVIDLYSRLVIGTHMSSSLTRHLVLNAFNQACLRRNKPQNVLFHSDQGIQYSCDDFRQLLKDNKAIQSMSRRGNCWDNAVAESFFATLKRELMFNKKFQDKREARITIFDYIETFYNRKRKHSALGYLPPLEFEKRLSN